MSELDDRIAEAFLKPGMTVLDIGSYKGETIGTYLRLGAATVYAFEPVEEYFRALQTAFDGEDRLRLCNCALADEDGERDLISPSGQHGKGSVVADFATRAAGILSAGAVSK